MRQRLFLLVSRTKSLCLVGVVLLSIQLVFGAGNEIMVSNNSELTNAIASSRPGDMIIMKDGEWKDVEIDFNATATINLPITLKAQTAGKVVLDGSSKLTFSKPNLKVDGLLFKGGSIKKGSVISFNSDNCTLANIAIVDYNPTDFNTKYYWVYFKGNHNLMTHCYFTGKSNMEPLVGNDREDSRYNTVSYCYIKDIPYNEANGREIFRIWGVGKNAGPSDDGAFFTVEYNLFDHADGEGEEIVSLKSNHNIVRYNTVRASMGGFNNRQGHYNLFEGNFLFGENRKRTSGIRISGENNRVVNNYIANMAEDGLRLMTGEYVETFLTTSFKPSTKDGKAKAIPAYWPDRNNLIANNTVINVGADGMLVGYGYKKHWPEMQMCMLPEDNRIKDNLFLNSSQTGIEAINPDNDPLTNFLHFKPNTFEGNIVSVGGIKGLDGKVGIIEKNIKGTVGKDGLFRARDAKEVDGAGADEYINNSDVCHPLQPSEVGPDWMIPQKR